MNDINKMPPKCQYCPYWEICRPPYVCPDIGDKRSDLQPTCNQLTTDAISRHGVSAWLDNMGYSKLADVVMDENRFPSVQPEQMRGKWEPHGYRVKAWDIEGIETWARVYKCSECGFVHSVIEDFGHYKFCPNCGADMRG